MIPPPGSDPQGDAARLEAEYIVRQLGSMSPDLKQRFTEDFAAAFWSALRGYALPDAKNFVNMRFLSNGSEVTTDSAGTTVGMSGGKSQFDILNFKGSSGIFINSATNARQLDVNVGGGGADCMFDVIVSPCFSTLTGWAEGTSYTSLSGCTFYGYTTVQAALNKAYALGSARTVYVCHGSYSENIDTPNFQVEINLVGAGCDAVTITGASSASPTFQINTIASGVFNISNMTLVGNGNNNVLTTVLGYPAFVSNLRIRVKSGGIGWTVGGLEIAQGVDIEGADSSETGILAGTAPVTWLSLEGVQVKDCNIGVNFANIRGVHMEDSRIISCATGILMNANRGAYDSTFTDILFDTCTTGISFLGNGATNTKFTGNTFLECNTAIDLTGAFLIPPDTVGMRGSIFSDNKFHTTTASFKGFNATRASLNQALTYCLITDNTFTGYTSGNEFFGTDNYGTGTQIFHNVSDAGALADFGSVVGHSSTGSGTAAPSAEPFVTIGNSANLSAERALTAGSGVGFTDGGANSTVTLNLKDLTGNWTQAGVFDISTAGNLVVLKHLAVGAGQTIDANSVLNVGETVTDPAATFNAIKGLLLVTMSADNAQATNALQYQVSTSGGHTLSGIMSGARLTTSAGTAGTVSDARGIYLLATAGISGGTITNRYGVYVANATGSGSVTNQYGVYIEAMTKGGTLNYGIYQAGAQNFLGGEIIAGPVTAPATPAATNLVVYNESGTQFLKVKDASGNVYNCTHNHVYAGVVDASTASTTKPFARVGPMPNAGVITDVRVLTEENIACGATSGIFDVHKVLSANMNTDGQGTTIFTTQANRPTISNGNMLSTTTAPDVTSFAAGDDFLLYTDQVGTSLTFARVSVTVRYT